MTDSAAATLFYYYYHHFYLTLYISISTHHADPIHGYRPRMRAPCGRNRNFGNAVCDLVSYARPLHERLPDCYDGFVVVSHAYICVFMRTYVRISVVYIILL
jgi:hypothetical protein